MNRQTQFRIVLLFVLYVISTIVVVGSPQCSGNHTSELEAAVSAWEYQRHQISINATHLIGLRWSKNQFGAAVVLSGESKSVVALYQLESPYFCCPSSPITFLALSIKDSQVKKYRIETRSILHFTKPVEATEWIINNNQHKQMDRLWTLWTDYVNDGRTDKLPAESNKPAQ